MRRVEQVEPFAFEVRRGETVGDHDDLAVRRILHREEFAGQLQAVLKVREVRRNQQLAYVRIAQVVTELYAGIVHGYRLGQERDKLRDMPWFCERIHLN